MIPAAPVGQQTPLPSNITTTNPVHTQSNMPPPHTRPTRPPHHNAPPVQRAPQGAQQTQHTGAPSPNRRNITRQNTATIQRANPPESRNVKFSEGLADRQSGRLMMLGTLAFLVFYLLVVASKLTTDYNSNKRAARSEHQTHARGIARQVATAIDDNIIWINNGLSEGKSPEQAARMISKSPRISATAILNGQNRVISKFPNTAGFLSEVSLSEMRDNAVQITSIIEPNGHIIPVIIKKSGNYYAVSALADDVLLHYGDDSSNARIALIATSGRVIAGEDELGRTGAMDWFNLGPTNLERITTSGRITFEDIRIYDTRFRIVSEQIPHSQLKLIEARPALETTLLRSNLILFSTLFIGTCTLVGLLLNSLYKQLNSIRTIQRETEVSQQRYQAAVEGDRGGIWELDIPNNTAYLSASLAGLLGMPRQEHIVSVSEFLNLFHPYERDKFLSVARRAHIQGEFEIDITVANLPLILQCRGRPSARTTQDFKRVIVGVALDITEQRNAQARLTSTEARLHNALSSMTDSFVVWDQSNRLVLWNPRFEEFFNVDPGNLHVGIDHASVDYMLKPSLLERIENKGHQGWYELKLRDGRWIRYIETQTAEGGRVSVGTDITEIRMREAELHENSTALKNTVDVLRKSQDRILELADGYEQEKIRAEEANQSKTDFLASMSHELRTPLNAINGFSDIMKKEMFGPLGDPRYKEYISDILFSGQHLLALINDILDMSKIEAGKMTLNTEIVYMHDMVAQVVRIIRGRAEDAQLTLDVHTDEVREIEADPRAVKQILLNLITNAIKFTPEGGTVGVDIIQKKSGLIMKIRDSGIGISKDNIERLAKPFEQVVATGNVKHTEGTGLGLALSKSLIELHGGNFKIESTLGKGTTVTFSLPNTPIARAEEPEENDVREEISRLAQDIANVLQPEEIPSTVSTPAPPQTTPPMPASTIQEIPQEQQEQPYIYAQPDFPKNNVA